MLAIEIAERVQKARTNLRQDRLASGMGCVDFGNNTRPVVAHAFVAAKRECARYPGLLMQFAHQLDLVRYPVRIGLGSGKLDFLAVTFDHTALTRRDHLDDAAACIADRLCHRHDFLFLGVGAWERSSIETVDGAAGRAETKGSSLNRFLHQFAHGSDIFGCCRFIPDPALAHYIGAQRDVRYMGDDIHRVVVAVDFIEIFGKTFIIEIDRRFHRVGRNFLDHF